MKTIGLICFALTALCLSPSYAQTEDDQLATLLVGKWRWTLHLPDPLGGSAIMETETVYQNNRQFSAISTTHYKLGPRQIYIEGTWEIKQGILTQHNANWSPRTMRNVDGSVSPIIIPQSERIFIRFLDRDRIQTKHSVLYRVY